MKIEPRGDYCKECGAPLRKGVHHYCKKSKAEDLFSNPVVYPDVDWSPSVDSVGSPSGDFSGDGGDFGGGGASGSFD